MNQTEKEFYFKTLHRTLSIPIYYGEANGKRSIYQSFSVMQENDAGFIANRLQKVFTKYPDKHVLYLVAPTLVLLGFVKSKDSSEFIMIGPIASPTCTEQDIDRYLSEARLSARTTRALSRYMNSVKPLTSDALKYLLLNINLIINNETLDMKDLIPLFDENTRVKMRFAEDQFKNTALNQEARDISLVRRYTEQIHFCIATGDLDNLYSQLNNIGDIPSPEQYKNGLSEQRINAYGSIFAAEIAALKSGIPPEDLNTTKQFYLLQIENAQNSATLQRMVASSLFDFTRLVRDYMARKTNDPTISRAINYIKGNISTKLTAKSVADAINVHPHYLFTHFKEETGLTLNQYINHEKITKACYYLTYTNHSLVSIAFNLSFSSQAYFQTVFKQIMGQTPAEWKKQNAYT